MSKDDRNFLDPTLHSLKEPATIDEIADRVLENGIPAAYRKSALLNSLKADIRRRIKHIKMPDGFPVWHSIVDEDLASGETVKRYVQLEFLDREDYVRIWQSWDKLEKRAQRMKRGLEKYYAEKFNGESLEQRMLEFMEGEEPEPVSVKASATVQPSKVAAIQLSTGSEKSKPR